MRASQSISSAGQSVVHFSNIFHISASKVIELTFRDVYVYKPLNKRRNPLSMSCHFTVRQFLQIILLSVIPLFSACGGGSSGTNNPGGTSGSGGPVQVENHITFPSHNSNIEGQTEITVSGKVTPVREGRSLDNHGAEVLVNGVRASFRSASSAYWSVKIPASLGDNEIEVSLTNADGAVDQSSITVQNIPDFGNIKASAFDASKSVMYFGDMNDGDIYQYDLNNNNMSVLYSAQNEGSLGGIWPVSMVFDDVQQRILVMDSLQQRLISIDAITGQGVEHARFGGVSLWGEWTIADLALDSANQVAYVADQQHIYPVNLVSNTLENRLEMDMPIWFDVHEGWAIEYDEHTHSLIVVVPPLDLINTGGGIYTYDLNTATFTRIFASYSDIDSGFFSFNDFDVVMTGQDTVVVCEWHGLVQINLQSQERTVLQTNTGADNDPVYACDDSINFHYDSELNRLVYNKWNGIGTFNLGDETSNDLFSLGVQSGAGEDLIRIDTFALDFEHNQGFLVLADSSIVQVSLEDGNKSALISSTAERESDEYYRAFSFALYDSGLLMFMDTYDVWPEVFSPMGNIDFIQVDVNTHSQVSIFDWLNDSDYSVPLEPSDFLQEAPWVHSAVLDSQRNTLLFSGSNTDLQYGAIYSLNLATQEQQEIHFKTYGYDETIGDFLPQSRPVISGVDGNNRVIVGDADGTISRLNIDSHEIEVIVGADDVREPELLSIVDVELDRTGNRVLVLDNYLAALIWVDLDSGSRTVVSGSGVGEGPNLDGVLDLQLDIDNQRAYVVHNQYHVYGEAVGELIMIDLTSGDRAIVAN